MGSILSLLTGLAAGGLAWQHWSDGTAFGSKTGPVFVIIVAIEFAVAGLGAGVLAARRKNDIIPAWIALVIGVHLFSMAPLLSYPLLYVVAALVSMGALAAIPTEVMVTRGVFDAMLERIGKLRPVPG